MTPHELEWKTRRDRIDKQLREMNPPWKIVPYKEGMKPSDFTTPTAVAEYPCTSGPCDYALFIKGQLLGIIEAKRVGVGPQGALEEAKRYSKGAQDGPGNWNGYRVPFLYSTNGVVTNFIDARDEQNLSREIAQLHTPTALEELYGKDFKMLYKWFDLNPISFDRIRDYQTEAVQNIEKDIQKGHRKILVAMATGTGKTYTTIALIHRLLESKSVRRVLFLVDRRSLAAQAVQAFNSFATPHGNKFTGEYPVYSQKFRKEDLDQETDHPYDSSTLPSKYLQNPDDSVTFVYVSTIQRMTINLFGKGAVFNPTDGDPEDVDDEDRIEGIPIHAFDVVIADECHRGYTSHETNTWQRVLNHFDAIKIGLTATPAQHTIQYFDKLTYLYPVEKAIQNGFLVDYEAVAIKSDIRINGVFLRTGESVTEVNTQTGFRFIDTLEDERNFLPGDIERRVTAPDSNLKIIQEIAKHALEHEQQTGRFPKILIFAVNDIDHHSHAEQLVRICREVFNRGDDFVLKITGKADRPLQYIKQFRNLQKPGVVVTVDMLSTGVDIPALEYIVFLRPVQSRILWVQMLGRGTRLCPEIHKTHFTVFDCFDGTLIKSMANATDFEVEIPERSSKSNKEIIENIFNNVDPEYNTKILCKRLRMIGKGMDAEARPMFALFIPEGDVEDYAKNLPKLLSKDFSKTMKNLRNQAFQDLLEDYPRAKKVFFEATQAVDQVESRDLFRLGGQLLKAEDYLIQFARFIHEKADEIEAVRILLKKPNDWKYQTLQDLKSALAQGSYPEQNLQRAHKIASHKDLADIISIVKHAAKDQEPVLSAQERVDRALNQIKQKHAFTREQLQWLEYIRGYLVANLSLEIEGFSEHPIFTSRGGITRANQVFGATLQTLVREINEAVAA